MEQYEQARANLEEAGIIVTDQDIQDFQDAIKKKHERENEIRQLLPKLDEEKRKEYNVLLNSLSWPSCPEQLPYALLINMGKGKYDDKTGVWTPTSTQVYAYEGIFDVSSMYTTFLRGINAIVPGAPFTDIREDLSGITEKWSKSDPLDLGTNGQRSVSFCCNGQAYCLTLDSQGFIFNDKMLYEIKRILVEQHFPHQLHTLSGILDDDVVLYYGTEKDANRIRRVIGTNDLWQV